MARSRSSQTWLKAHFSDPYVKRAQQEGYRSRAVYKLIEIQKKDRLFKPGMIVVDLGAAPGGWSQLLAKWVGNLGQVFATDILAMDPIAGVSFIQGDFQEAESLERLKRAMSHRKADAVVSDISPNLSGLAVVDQPKIIYLAELALELALDILKPEGFFLIKLFQGNGFDSYLRLLRRSFAKVCIRKPSASRKQSPELYLLAKGYRAYSAIVS